MCNRSEEVFRKLRSRCLNTSIGESNRTEKDMYAVIKTGGKQYQVEEGQILRIEKVKGEVGDKIALDQVLVVGGDSLKVGKPYLEGAKVEATIKAQDRAKKIIVGKFKAKKGYKRKQGHRQPYTLISIDHIQG